MGLTPQGWPVCNSATLVKEPQLVALPSGGGQKKRRGSFSLLRLSIIKDFSKVFT